MRRTARGAGVALALLVAGLPATGASDAPEAGTSDGAAEACAPLHVDDPLHWDLQRLVLETCRALRGDAEPGAAAERLRVRVGGWLDGSYQDNDHPADDFSVGLNHVNLHLDVRWDDRLQLFAEGEYEHEPELTGFVDEREWELEQLWAEYAHGDALRLRAGRFGTPFGYWTPVHWSILVDTIEDPLHEANRVVPEQQIGVGLFGSFFGLGGGRGPGTGPGGGPGPLEPELAYALYAGYAADGFDAGKAEGLTAGADLRLRLADRHFLGVSLYTQENGDESDRRERNLMLYGEVRLPFRLLARAEYLWQHRSGRTRAGFVRDLDQVYAKLRWDFRPDAYLNYRIEYGEDDRYGFSADHLVNRFTAGYRPVPRVVLKAEYARHEREGRILDDYHFWGVSAGLFF